MLNLKFGSKHDIDMGILPLNDERWFIILDFIDSNGIVNRSDIYNRMGNPSKSLRILIDRMISEGFVSEVVRPRYNIHQLMLTDKGAVLLSKLRQVNEAYSDGPTVGPSDPGTPEKADLKTSVDDGSLTTYQNRYRKDVGEVRCRRRHPINMGRILHPFLTVKERTSRYAQPLDRLHCPWKNGLTWFGCCIPVMQ
ncbi:MAG: winged helix-turn-helix transcriptional regulator [Candidatus Methanomethylophilaceae archaeon]|nr:winged helix-turn-helix transcriptional regulator [Candidatus Methanomethylophilaceae archaeon]